MSHYFAELILTNKPIILVGGGKVAHRKLQGVLECQAQVTVVSPQLCPPMERLWAEKRFVYIQEGYESHHLSQTPPPILVFAATSDSLVNQQVAMDCQEKSILCNVVDLPVASTFLVPAVVRRPILTMAVSTGGQSPALSRILKEYLDQEIPPGWDRLIQAFGQWRPLVREALDDPGRREKFWQQTARLALLERAFLLDNPTSWLENHWKKYLSLPKDEDLE
ncbi:MAG: bifunctional precorrin-2 dehydrogenase/sirohydrochlorin ferrochelatase [Magnetococcales bacterium]|nr:bifunctional precorrin-2 dehydrogenase/sirohydrochlorin ferrochelatase [Magnetococcales bacterium]